MTTPEDRPRARDLGITIGVLPPGPLNAITDIAGVRVGHCTVWEREAVLNALFRATTVSGIGGHILYELPIGRTQETLHKYGRI